MSLRDAYQQKFEAQLQEQKARLELLRARAKRAAAHGRILAYEELANADTHFADAKAKLKTLANVGGHALSELKSGVSRAYSDLKTASQRAADHLRADASAPPPAKPKPAAKAAGVRKAKARSVRTASTRAKGH